MARRPSRQTLAVLAALADEPQAWRYGYELGKEVALEAGTLYPILMRLSDRGLLEAAWEADPPVGRPRRHLYRLSAAGELAAAEARAAVPNATVPRRGARRRAAPPGDAPAHRRAARSGDVSASRRAARSGDVPASRRAARPGDASACRRAARPADALARRRAARSGDAPAAPARESALGGAR
ncbi:MAG: PadR family transcriptional regulator, regulatory protein PadR [Solirubrobacteraceae bacterium]|jgi:DNA-binding PadR family transcriptional regulator|nr:PadR family transcriptional regulator, regulatory protein PadR [Solirubrobacteraceae bacterium]